MLKSANYSRRVLTWSILASFAVGLVAGVLVLKSSQRVIYFAWAQYNSDDISWLDVERGRKQKSDTVQKDFPDYFASSLVNQQIFAVHPTPTRVWPFNGDFYMVRFENGDRAMICEDYSLYGW